MKLSRREELFAHRIFVLAIVAAVMGIGVVVVKESREIQKLIEPSIARDLLLLCAPLAGLAMTGYSLAGRAFASGGLKAEILGLSGAFSIFLAVALPSFLKRQLASSETCRVWQIFCKETLSVRDHRLTLLFGAVAVVLIILSLRQARVNRVDHGD
ncbi:hypothetical protein ACFORG_09150 [Lutimaribacter marinistellae]|uniref:Uncharacterized protein n=1 Tax=Lutimaribacter marinistellae TaxID=1820329 RepID=A0ABV7TEA6_9RHOB